MGIIDFKSKVKRLLRRASYDKLLKMHLQGMDVLQELYDLVHDNDINIRSHIAHALLWLVQRDADLIDPYIRILTQLLDDEELFVRVRACDAFDVIVTVGEYYNEEKQVISKIIALLDDEPMVQEIVIPIIGKMAKKHPEEMADAIPKLIQLLESRSSYLKEIVSNAIGAMEITFESFPETVKPHIATLIKLLNINGRDSLATQYSRGSAAFILGKIGAVEALGLLSPLFDDDRGFYLDNKATTVAEVAREAYRKIEIIALIDKALEEKTER